MGLPASPHVVCGLWILSCGAARGVKAIYVCIKSKQFDRRVYVKCFLFPTWKAWPTGAKILCYIEIAFI